MLAHGRYVQRVGLSDRREQILFLWVFSGLLFWAAFFLQAKNASNLNISS